jgi:putative transposase
LHPQLSIIRQCELLSLPRSSFYYSPVPESEENLRLLRMLDELYLEHPTLGSRKLAVMLSTKSGLEINRKRVQRLRLILGLEAFYPKPRLSKPDPDRQIYPYLLRDVAIIAPNQVWSTDITYIPMRNGFLYLTAVIDWYSRFILSWELSNTLEASFCRDALNHAFRWGQPLIFNTDQGTQFTSEDFLEILKGRAIQISMDGVKRFLDNIFIERFWRTLKYDLIYVSDFADGHELHRAISLFIDFYNYERPHQALHSSTPANQFPGAKQRQPQQ